MRRNFCFVALVLGVLASSCGRDRAVSKWNDRLLEAGKTRDRGQYSEAEAEYFSLLEKAPDKKSKRLVYAKLGELARSQDRTQKAIDYYERAWSGDVKDELAARAFYRTVRLRNQDTAWQKLADGYKKVIRQYPGSVYAEFATKDLRQLYHQNNATAQLPEVLTGLFEDVEKTEVADALLFAKANILNEELEQPEEARREYRRVYHLEPNGALANDALWEIAKLYRRHQLWEPALDILEILASDLETSWFIGVYNSPFANDARMEMGMIHLLFLENNGVARKHFRQYRHDFPTSLYLDDAMWHLVESYRIAGKEEQYREECEKFIKQFPESKYNRIIKRRFPDLESQN